MPIRALRGATTVVEDTADQVRARVKELLAELFRQNEIDHDDVISVIFTATEDVRSMFPATAAREFGLGDVPLLCARELDIAGGTPLCIRVMLHLETERDRSGLSHVYLEGAQNLRDDLPG